MNAGSLRKRRNRRAEKKRWRWRFMKATNPMWLPSTTPGERLVSTMLDHVDRMFKLFFDCASVPVRD
jgi:hypothetical protein